MTLRVGIVGVGAMGLPMAKRIIGAGHTLAFVPHRNSKPRNELASLGAEELETPAELASACDAIVTCLPDVPQVAEVLFGETGLLKGAAPGSLFIDVSTIAPASALEHHRVLSEHGMMCVDAPVSGGPARAAEGTLTIMAGGAPEAVERARPVLSAFGSKIVHVGGPGAGQAAKHVNQLMISIIMIANAEALSLGVKAGLPLETLVEVIGTSSGSNYLLQSWMPQTLFAGKLEGGFALDLLQKDLSASLRWAAELGVPAFGGALAQQLYGLAQSQGAGRLDYSVVARFYEESAGIELRLPIDEGERT